LKGVVGEPVKCIEIEGIYCIRQIDPIGTDGDDDSGGADQARFEQVSGQLIYPHIRQGGSACRVRGQVRLDDDLSSIELRHSAQLDPAKTHKLNRYDDADFLGH